MRHYNVFTVGLSLLRFTELIRFGLILCHFKDWILHMDMSENRYGPTNFLERNDDFFHLLTVDC